MRKFITTLALFLAPIALLCMVFVTALWRSGEASDMPMIVEQTVSGSLTQFGFGFRDETRAYKQHVASQVGADLLVLGTSRSMQFRSGFFANCDSFYNAGGSTAYLEHVLPFLQNMGKDALPKKLLLVLDQYFFNDDWAQLSFDITPEHYEFTQPNYGYLVRRMFTSFSEGKYNLLDVLATQKGVYGISASGRNAGFYADGSYSYGTAVDHPEDGLDYQFADTYDRIARNTNRFEYGDTVSEQRLAVAQELFAWCENEGITVTVVLPPYAPSVWQAMMEKGTYGYMTQLPQALGTVCAEYGVELVDCSYLPDTTDAQYIDGFHGSDRVYANVCMQLAQQSKSLAPYFDANALHALFVAQGNPRTVNLPNE